MTMSRRRDNQAGGFMVKSPIFAFLGLLTVCCMFFTQDSP